MTTYPTIRWTVLDAEDPRALAEFYRDLFGLTYQDGHETPQDGEDWLKLEGGPTLAFQKVDRLPRSTWPGADVPQQLHLDATVDSFDDLVVQRDRALALGATLALDRSDDPDEALYVFTDPAGHPFCIFVA